MVHFYSTYGIPRALRAQIILSAQLSAGTSPFDFESQVCRCTPLVLYIWFPRGPPGPSRIVELIYLYVDVFFTIVLVMVAG